MAHLAHHIGRLLHADWDRVLLWGCLGALATIALVWFGQNTMVCAAAMAASCSQLMSLARPNARDAKLPKAESRCVEFGLVIALGCGFLAMAIVIVGTGWFVGPTGVGTSLLALGMAAACVLIVGAIYIIGANRHWNDAS